MRSTVRFVRISVLTLILSVSAVFSQAQSISSPDGKFEVGLGFGPMFFLGDLGGNLGTGTTFIKDVNLPVTKMQKGIFANFYPKEWIGFRVALNHGVLEGADSLIKEKGGAESFRYVRNLHFRSTLLEAYAAIEIYPTVFFEQFEGLQGKIRPYGIIGWGFFKHKPQAQVDPTNPNSPWVDLEPLRIEGQGMTEYPDRPRYKLTNMEMPLGVGVKWYVKENMYIGMEILHRKTFTDYIDDLSKDYIDPALYDKYLSPQDANMARIMQNRKLNGGPSSNGGTFFVGEQRGNETNNDSFFSSILRFGWRLFDNSDASGMGCPKW